MSDRIIRRLAAIVAMDVAGYSRLMRSDEEATLRALRAHRAELIDPTLARFGGRIANTAGDSILIEFPSALEAVRCAIAIQTAMADRNDGVAEDEQIRFRAGINVGDVISEGDDLLGDGVNVAARVEALAEPGGICLSRAARDQIRDLTDVNLVDLGEVEVKNIDRPVRVFRIDEVGCAPVARARSGRRRTLIAALGVAAATILAAALWWWQTAPDYAPADPGRFAFALPDKPSVAVMPFTDLSEEGRSGPLADAIADDIANNLSQISGLFVIARQATEAFRDRQAEIRRVAEELGVRHVVLGNVRRVGERIRVNAQLVDALTGRQIWAERFDREVGDIFALQDDITRAISTRLSNSLSWSAGARLTDNVEAHMTWLSAQDHILPTSPERLAHAGKVAERAIALDPAYSRGYALKALALTQKGYFGYVDDGAAAIEEGLALARRAVELAPDDWYSQFVLGQSLMNTRDYEGAVAAFERAVALDPSNGHLLTHSALPLIFLGRPDAAITRIETALRLNPYQTWLPPQFLGQAYVLRGEYETALIHLKRANRLNPKFIGGYYWLAVAHAMLGEGEMARQMVDRILSINPGATISNSFIIIQNDEMMERLRRGWRKAGLPE